MTARIKKFKKAYVRNILDIYVYLVTIASTIINISGQTKSFIRFETAFVLHHFGFIFSFGSKLNLYIAKHMLSTFFVGMVMGI